MVRAGNGVIVGRLIIVHINMNPTNALLRIINPCSNRGGSCYKESSKPWKNPPSSPPIAHYPIPHTPPK